VSSVPHRLLVVCPSWVGDAVMATPTLRELRQAFPGAFIGALVRPGIDQVLSGLPFIDEFHVERAGGMMGPKHAAAKVRPRRYDTALLLTNSFSTALTTRIAGVPERIGYDRDGRGLLLTRRLAPPKRADGSYAPVPAVDYYLALSRAFLTPLSQGQPSGPMELAVVPEDDAAAEAVLAKAGVQPGERFAILNPGGNNPAKRWPADRFAAIAARLRQSMRLRVLVNGSPGEAALTEEIAAAGNGLLGSGGGESPSVASLATLGITIGSLKGVVRRAALMVTNDTGPRHIAAAFGVPLVSLFGPTDHRWTTIPTRPGGPEAVLLADPTLPEELMADDHPERCRVDRIEIESVWAAVERVLGRG
jgi:heptosyltransferase-2